MASLLTRMERVPAASLVFYPGNPRHGNIAAIAESLTENAQYAPIVVQTSTRHVLSGNHTLMAAQLLGWEHIDVVMVDVDDARARKIVLSSNRTAELAVYDDDALAELLSYLNEDYIGTGWTADDVERLITPPEPPPASGNPTLADRFLIPPFDVLDARQGWWRERRKQWIGLGIRSELGRAAEDGSGDPVPGGAGQGSFMRDTKKYQRGNGLPRQSESSRGLTYHEQKVAAERMAGRPLTAAEFEASHYVPSTEAETGTSIFDPVLCELTYRWFSPPAGAVLDPFAGGSVRGLVAAVLGRTYIGNDLSPGQIEANREQGDAFTARGLVKSDTVTWTSGDSATWVGTLPADSADLLFTCPPYLWLERYSDDPADLSNMTEAGFEAVYTRILTGAARALRPDRYAVIVTGDVRDSRTGRLADFRAMTVRAAAVAGLSFQSGAVLVKPAGSLAARAARTFQGTRALGRTHQDVLVFCKGNRGAAAKACGDVDVHLPDEVANVWENGE